MNINLHQNISSRISQNAPCIHTDISDADISPVSPLTVEARRYVLVGTGARAHLYIHALCSSPHRMVYHRLVGLCDTSETRMRYSTRVIAGWMDHHASQDEHFHLSRAEGIPRCFLDDDFSTMLDRLRPDCVIVCAPNDTHAGYCMSALRHNCDVICESPLATSHTDARKVEQTEKYSRGTVRMVFNDRYIELWSQVHALLQKRDIGSVLSVEFCCHLDRYNGADKFRQWHADKSKSADLLLHQACHHFDLLRWWLEDEPYRITALGSLAYYGARNAQARGEGHRTAYGRYTPSPTQASALTRQDVSKKDDPFALNLPSDNHLRALYYDAEVETNYIRDRNVFGSHINIHDNFSVLTRMREGIHVTYTLNAFSPTEETNVYITGTHGRLEAILSQCNGPQESPSTAKAYLNIWTPSNEQTQSTHSSSTAFSGTEFKKVTIDMTAPENIKRLADERLMNALFDIPSFCSAGNHQQGEKQKEEMKALTPENVHGSPAMLPSATDGCWAVIWGASALQSLQRDGHPFTLVESSSKQSSG